MNIIRKIISSATITIFALFALSGAAYAADPLFNASKEEACKGANMQNVSSDECKSDSDAASNQIEGTIGRIIDLLTVVVGIIAVILIIINGMRFITANGDSGSITTARNGVIYAIVGLIVAALAQVITKFVLSRI